MSLKQADVQTAHKLQSDAGYTYIDVRSIPEFENGHPTGAHNVPLLNLDSRTGQMQPNEDFLAVVQANYATDSKLLVGCQMGGRSTQAGQILIAAGYQDVTNVVGGFGGAQNRITGEMNEGWVDAGLPVEQGAPTENSYQALQQKVVTSD
jgi:rhodanese-related sulfurtransferase